jgi:hypothetical protein
MTTILPSGTTSKPDACDYFRSERGIAMAFHLWNAPIALAVSIMSAVGRIIKFLFNWES